MKIKKDPSSVSDLSNRVPFTEIVQIEDTWDEEAEIELSISNMEFEAFSRYYLRIQTQISKS